MSPKAEKKMLPADADTVKMRMVPCVLGKNMTQVQGGEHCILEMQFQPEAALFFSPFKKDLLPTWLQNWPDWNVLFQSTQISWLSIAARLILAVSTTSFPNI